MTEPAFDVVVVGGGPVGAATALALRAAGFDVALVERGPPPTAFDARRYDRRVYAISPASMALLTRVGVWPSIAARRVSPYVAMRVWVEHLDRGLSFSAADVARGELGWIVEHGLLVDALWRALRVPDGVRTYCGAAVESVHFGDDALSVLQLSDGPRLQSRLLVAADGADSSLRVRAGIGTLGWRYDQRAVVCHVQTSDPHQRTAWQRFLPSGPLAFLPLADGRCSIVWSADDALASEIMSLDDAAFRKRLSASVDGALGTIHATTPRLAVPLRLLHAQEYVRPSLVLVGDAAHTVHPLAGQGVNLGFADADTLAQTLSTARERGTDWRATRCLQRYARARKAENLAMLAVTDGLYRLFGTTIPGLRPLLEAGMGAADALRPLKRWMARQAVGV